MLLFYSNLVFAKIHFFPLGKVIVDMVVDSLPISSRQFICSAKANCSLSTCQFCNMFIWKNGTAATVNIQVKNKFKFMIIILIL